MAREFVQDPETGKAAVAVTTYQVIELDELRQVVTNAQADRDSKAQAAEAANNALNEAEVTLQNSKSELESGEAVTSDPGTDAGAEGASSENQDGDSTETVEF